MLACMSFRLDRKQGKGRSPRIGVCVSDALHKKILSQAKKMHLMPSQFMRVIAEEFFRNLRRKKKKKKA